MFVEAFVLMLLIAMSVEDLSSDIEAQLNKSLSLSRKKRYLVFPTGSSLQVVYELVMPVSGMPNIYTFSVTTSLAWQLPDEPYDDFKKAIKDKTNSSRRVDKPSKAPTGGWSFQAPPQKYNYNNNYANELYSKYPPISSFSNMLNRYKFSNAPRPTTTYQTYKPYNRQYASNRRQNNYNYRQPTLPPIYRDVHRRTRRHLFEKIEQFFTAQQRDGRACLFKAICEISKTVDGTGSFMEEIIKTIFRNHHSHEEEDDYDIAANDSHNCEEMYLNCTYK